MTSRYPPQCHRCGGINLEDIFSRQNLHDSIDGVPVADINELSRSCRRARCPTCRFLAWSTRLMDRATIADTWHLRAFNFDSVRYGFNIGTTIPTEKLVIALLPGASTGHFPEGLWSGINDCILPVRKGTCSESVGTCTGQVVNSRSVDYSIIKSWIGDCTDNHMPQCEPSPKSLSAQDLSTLKVIDCVSGDVISFPGGEFVTLSYCIGPKLKTRVSPQTSTKLSPHFVRVVSDSIRCCVRLGYQYLWVDQICIDQNNSKVLADTISKMNLIYSSAALTIVSLGASQREGLPGVSNSSRRARAKLETESNTYITTMSGLPTAINRSKWITRAWCYQEAVLSRRLLIFGEEQVYFVCNSSTYCESIGTGMDHSGLALSGLRAQGHSHLLPIQPEQDNEGVWAFGSWVSAYTSRDFTFQGDALHAFRGILNISKHQSYWGIPSVVNTLQQQANMIEAFALGLSWSTSYNKHSDLYQWTEKNLPHSEDFYRRREFPSWSYASCKTSKVPIMYKVPGDFIYEFEIELYSNSVPKDVQIYLEDESGKSFSIASIPEDWKTGSAVLAERSKFIQIEAEMITIKLCRLESILRDTHEGYAKFCIRVMGDSILSADSVELPSMSPSDDPISELEDGRFLVDFDRPPTTKNGYCDEVHGKESLGLILLHRLRHDDHDDMEDESDLQLEGEYCVLLIERHASGDFYERVGLVWIHSDHLDLFHKRTKRIRLG